MIAKSKHPQTSFFEERIPNGVPFFYLTMEMLPAIQFND